MENETTKLKVLQKLMNVQQDTLLEKVDQLLDKEMTVAYTSEGEPLTKEAYDARLRKAEEQLRNGEHFDQDDVEKEAENW